MALVYLHGLMFPCSCALSAGRVSSVADPVACVDVSFCRLHAFDRKVHFSNHAKQVQRLKHALGAKIAKYFEAEHSNL